MEVISAKLILVLGAKHIGIYYPYSVKLHQLAGQLPGVRWNHAYRRFCIPATRQNLGVLIEHFAGIANVDISALKNNEIQKPPQKRGVPNTLLPVKKGDTKIAARGQGKSQITQVNLDKIKKLGRVMEERRYSRSTIDTYLSMLRQFMAYHSPRAWDQLNKDDIVEFNHAVFIKRNLSYSTQNQAINAIKLFYAVHGGLVVPEEIQRPRRSTRLPEVLTKEEFKAIFSKLRNLKHRALVGLVYGCGLRIGEAINLELQDIRPEAGILYVRQGKGRNDRPVPLSSAVNGLLDKYIRVYAPGTWLFEGKKGGQYSYSSSRQLFKRAVRASGLRRHITLHTLRHSYATHLLQSGTDIRYIQEILGHRDPKTTMIYTRVTMHDLRSIKSPFDDMDL
ncbi:MAG: integrase [Bacteroidetes bacterium]|nr:MAG: integrase [Bacteroidota bacterium]